MIRGGKEFQLVIYSFAPLFFPVNIIQGMSHPTRGGESRAAMLLLLHVPIDARKTTRGRDRASLGDMWDIFIIL